MKCYYYEDENGCCYIKVTTYSFQNEIDMKEWAKEKGCELVKIEAPEGFDANNYDDSVW